MKRGVFILVFCLCVSMIYGQTNQALQQLLQTEGLKNAAVGISIKRLADGKTLLAHQEEMSLIPASVTKIIPTWFAFQKKGAQYKYTTSIYYSGIIENGTLLGDIIVRANGDPTIDSRYFPKHKGVDAIIAAIQKLGIKHIQGNVRVEGAEVGMDIPGTWPWEDVSNYYAALYLPFNYRDNTYTLEFQSGKVGSLTKLVRIEPQLPNIKVENQVKAATSNSDDAWIFGGPFSSSLCVRGSIPANRTAFKVKGAMHNPASVFVNEVTTKLAKRNISVEKQKTVSTTETELLKLYSAPLKDIIHITNKVSVNLFAEALGDLAIGGGDQWSKEVVVLLKNIGIDASGVLLKDACGLSPMGAAPARVFTDLLTYIGKQDNQAFVNSLPLAGADGGLLGYCHASPRLKNNLKAKTGSMAGVRCLAGFLSNQAGEQLAVTILVNHYSCTTSQLQRAIGRFLQSL